MAMLCYAWTVTSALQETPVPQVTAQYQGLCRPLSVTVVCLGAGLALQGWVLFRLATTAYAPSYPRWFLLSLAFLLLGLLWNERWRLHFVQTYVVGLGFRHMLEALYVAAMVGVFTKLSTFDLGSWYYSSLGDEYAFYYAAKPFAQGALIVNLFSQHGAYDIIPFLSSYIEGKLMLLIGTDVIGWKTSVIVQVAAALGVAYLLARALYGYRVAILTLGMLATSHYLLAYSHTGYPNLETLLPTLCAVHLTLLGLRRDSFLLLGLGGACAGLGWYTYYPSRATIVILAMVILVSVAPRRWFRVGTALMAGFLCFFLPLAVVNGSDLIRTMLEQTGSGTTTEYAANRAMLPLWNTGRSLLAFNYNMHNGPYLYGSLAEPVTAALFVLGLGYVIATWRDSRSRLILVWFTIGIITTGILSKYDYVSVSRLNYLLPVVAILAALAFDHVIVVLQAHIPVALRPAFVAVVFAGVLGLISVINLHRWFIEAPAAVASVPDAVAVRVISQPQCLLASQLPLVVDVGLGGALGPALDARGEAGKVQVALYTDPRTWIKAMPARCVIFRSPTDPRAIAAMQAIARHWPRLQVVTERDISGATTILVYYPQPSMARHAARPQGMVQ
jgi:hypothetical protein